jgi:hypothetical protein
MILIAGDSWGCGEWSSTEGITHGGLAQHLIDNNLPVVNISLPGGNNDEIVTYTKFFLKNNRHLKISKVVLFQTDILRKPNPPDLSRGWLDFKTALCYGYFNKIQDVARSFEIQFLVVGGLADIAVPEQQLNLLPNVSIACQSFTNLIFNNCADIANPITSNFGYDSVHIINKIKSYSTADDIEILLGDIEEQNQRQDIVNSNRQWFPDGAHPGHDAHKKLFEYLLSNNYLK